MTPGIYVLFAILTAANPVRPERVGTVSEFVDTPAIRRLLPGLGLHVCDGTRFDPKRYPELYASQMCPPTGKCVAYAEVFGDRFPDMRPYAIMKQR